ncbi:MAG: hypothetical protein WCS97_02570 [Candidatus Paceibacterota bacterium]|jgi:hypothetical protein
MRRALLVSSLSLLLFLPLAASAQAIGSMDAFTVTVDPQYPAPQSQAALSAVSSTLDLTGATMVVLVAGKEIYRGNVQPIAIPLGKAGSVTAVVVTMLAGGTSYSQTLSIQPQDVVLIAEPISSSPPLYPGKSLVPLEGDVRVVAMASLRDAKGKVVDPSTYSYAWTVDGAQIARASGIGKDTILVASPLQYRSRSVSVAVAGPGGSLVGGAALSLTPSEPLVRIYENDPLLGIRYERALPGSYSITDTEKTLYAAPFSFPTTGGVPFLEWFLNGSTAQTGSSITLRPTGSGEGSASLSLTASAGESARATTDLSLSFGAAAGGFNFFGL